MPSIELLRELNRASLLDLADALTRFVREACAGDPDVARALSYALYQGIPEAEDADPPRLLKVADFLAEIGDPPPALVPDFLPSQKLIVLSGAAKQGKSLVGLELLHAVSRGGRLLGRFPIERPGPVAYFGLEDGGHEIKARLLQRGVSADADNFYVCWNTFDMASAPGMDTFRHLISSMPEPPSLVVIDTAREAFKVRDWNDAALIGPVLSPLREWTRKNCTVILITHNNKDKFASGVNKISGSGALVSSCDAYMILENQKVLDSGNLRWDWEMGGRGLKQTKHILEMDTDTLHVRVLDGQEIGQAQAEEKQAERKIQYHRVAQALDSADGKRLTIKKLAFALECGYDFAYQLVREMGSQGDAEKSPETEKEGSGRPSPLYRLTEKGQRTYLLGNPALGQSPPTNKSRPQSDVADDDTEDF